MNDFPPQMHFACLLPCLFWDYNWRIVFYYTIGEEVIQICMSYLGGYNTLSGPKYLSHIKVKTSPRAYCENIGSSLLRRAISAGTGEHTQ